MILNDFDTFQTFRFYFFWSEQHTTWVTKLKNGGGWSTNPQVLPDTVRTVNGRPMPSARRSSRRSTRRVVVDLLGFAND